MGGQDRARPRVPGERIPRRVVHELVRRDTGQSRGHHQRMPRRTRDVRGPVMRRANDDRRNRDVPPDNPRTRRLRIHHLPRGHRGRPSRPRGRAERGTRKLPRSLHRQLLLQRRTELHQRRNLQPHRKNDRQPHRGSNGVDGSRKLV